MRVVRALALSALVVLTLVGLGLFAVAGAALALALMAPAAGLRLASVVAGAIRRAAEAAEGTADECTDFCCDLGTNVWQAFRAATVDSDRLARSIARHLHALRQPPEPAPHAPLALTHRPRGQPPVIGDGI